MAIPFEMLLHPELLTNEQLILVIQERHLHVPNMENMPRHELLELFHNFCVPHGQRKYRDSGRGKVLNKTRPVSPEPKTKLNTLNNNLNRKSLHPWPTDRLKPPPDMITGHAKMIKIEAKSVTPVYSTNNCKRKISIESATPATDSPPPKKARKPITWP